MRSLIKFATVAALVASSSTRAGDDEVVGPPAGARIVVGPGSLDIVLPEARIRRGLTKHPGGRATASPGAEPQTRPEDDEAFGPRSSPPRLERSFDDLGTTITPDPDAGGGSLRFQEGFAAAFARADPSPAERTAHFDWLPHYDGHPVWHVGWLGEISRTERRGDGSWIVRIQLKPNLHSDGGLKTLLLDYVEETYRVEGEAFELIDSDAATPRPKLQVFPLFY
ncbi:hypothetical protein [Planctomyces sp. SH-PL62]|uniref:hypothetical protein n=1 Tax=Planctomyces sp. SH-PL62 TaxID=1636152 RepID=UPI00078B907C|nr:hypothetical protein [Planctomyces sp. SH-PL62]AMV37754.1 hypothetical protein VT85_09980 [Planctomyces sp. SH-PL62]